MGDACPVTGPTDRLPREDVTTVEIPRVPDDPTPEPAEETPTRRSGFWRELSGALAAGLLVLAVVVLAIQVVDQAQGMPGPGVLVVIAHFLCAAGALALQRQADRRRGPQAGLMILLIGVVTGIAVWFFWWA